MVARPFAVLLAVLLLAPLAQASHMRMYASNPVEHDDRGRSDEPDRGSTAVLGPFLENRILDLDRDGVAAADSALPPPPGVAKVIAPGCTDDSGRRASGLCGICTVPPLGLQPGRCFAGGPHAPGAYTPRRDTVIRFLDVRVDAVSPAPTFSPGNRVDVNHKFEDTGLRGLGVPAFLAGPVAFSAWLGDWQDKNGNGVIDHLDHREGDVDRNEFVWYGGCRAVTFVPPDAGRYCTFDPGNTRMLGYAFPGNHHATCGVAVESTLAPWTCHGPADAPGVSIACFADAVLTGAGPVEVGRCGPGDDPDAHEERFQGDPLLGGQGSVRADQAFLDRTGEPSVGSRGWFYGTGWAAWYYDQSLVVHHVFVAAYGAPPDARSPNEVRLRDARFLDVDRADALHPALDALVQGTVKPAARGAWVAVRDVAPPA